MDFLVLLLYDSEQFLLLVKKPLLLFLLLFDHLQQHGVVNLAFYVTKKWNQKKKTVLKTFKQLLSFVRQMQGSLSR